MRVDPTKECSSSENKSDGYIGCDANVMPTSICVDSAIHNPSRTLELFLAKMACTFYTCLDLPK